MAQSSDIFGDERPTLLSRAADAVIRARLPLLLICIVTAALAWMPAQQLSFDRSVEGLFDPDDPRLATYHEGKELFGGGETALVLTTDPQLLTVEGLARLQHLGDSLAALPGVEGVVGLFDAKLPGAPLNPRSLSEHLSQGTLTSEELREALTGSDLYRDRLISQDGQTTVLLVTLAAAGQAAASRAETIEAIREIADAHSTDVMVAGGPVLVEDVFRHLEDDGRTLGLTSTLVLAVVIGLLFRNLRWLILPLAVVHVTLLWTKALLVLSGKQLSMVSSPLVALVTVIGVATVVHITIRYREERDNAPPRLALHRTIVHIGPAVFWTCLTTAAGFLALLASSVVPVAGFGTMMALGSLMVFVATVMLLPAGALLGGVHTDPGKTPGGSRITNALNALVAAVERAPKRIAAAAVIVLAIAGLGALRLEVATNFDENFRDSSPIVQSYRVLADRMGAIAVFDLFIEAPDVTNDEEVGIFFENIRTLQHELNDMEGIEGTLSAVDVIDFVGDVRSEWSSPGERIQTTMFQRMQPSRRLELLLTLQPELMAGFWNRDRNVVRIILETGDVEGGQPKRDLIESVERSARALFPGARVSGVEILLAYMVQSLVADQWITFSLAVAAILVMMMAAFRSWKLGLIALVPNAAPIVLVVGIMGWVGLKVNTATAMLASVSMGLAVDFSIHYLYRFRQERRTGSSLGDALRNTHRSVGLAMVLANVALIAGFSALTFSAFVPTVHFGLLVSVAMLGGLVGNLIAMPLLLRLLYR